MKPETQAAIRLLLLADNSVDATKRAEVLSACIRIQRHRKLITLRRTAEILGCHGRTVERYARRGLLTPIRYSQRMIRYDLEEVQTFAINGLDAMKTKGTK